MSITERESQRERESFIRNNLHNGVVSGAARGRALLGPMWAGRGSSSPSNCTCAAGFFGPTPSEALVFEKVPSRPWNHRSPRGAFTLLGPDFIYSAFPQT